MLQFFKHELSMEQSKFSCRTTQYSYRIFFHRRDFRLLKLDPTTKQVVANPLVWVEMNGTEIVAMNKPLDVYIYICL
jgi:hypothetical protein